MKHTIKKYLQETIDVKQQLADKHIDQIHKVALAVLDCFKAGGKLIAFGNGGSASDAAHFVAELVGRFKKERDALPAIALSTNTSSMTAIANDYGYEKIFLRQLQSIANPKDIVVGISTSGKSPSVVKPIAYAKENGLYTLALTGLPGKPLSDLADLSIVIPTDNTPLIQEAHISVIHLICQLVEEGVCDLKIKEAKNMVYSKIFSPQDLIKNIELDKKQKKKIVFTNGCFDVLHVGHVRYLDEAKKLGDKLIVALNTDKSVKKIKGDKRPIVSQNERLEIIAALGCVDYVTFFDEETPHNIISFLKPNILVKGGDYNPDQVVGKDVVESYGGKVVILPFHKGVSTTDMVEKIRLL